MFYMERRYRNTIIIIMLFPRISTVKCWSSNCSYTVRHLVFCGPSIVIHLDVVPSPFPFCFCDVFNKVCQFDYLPYDDVSGSVSLFFQTERQDEYLVKC